MSKEKSTRAKILEAHEEDCTTPAWRIAIICGTSEDYVHSCLSQTGRRIGSPFCDTYDKGHQKHFLVSRFKAKASRNEICQRVWLHEGQLVQCAFETFNGAAYCPECALHLITCLDRKSSPVVSVKAPRSHPWAEAAAAGVRRKTAA